MTPEASTLSKTVISMRLTADRCRRLAATHSGSEAAEYHALAIELEESASALEDHIRSEDRP
jgi:hypothetical protein